jgi:hypothetical protein
MGFMFETYEINRVPVSCSWRGGTRLTWLLTHLSTLLLLKVKQQALAEFGGFTAVVSWRDYQPCGKSILGKIHGNTFITTAI